MAVDQVEDCINEILSWEDMAMICETKSLSHFR
jgi:hypothetical protein